MTAGAMAVRRGCGTRQQGGCYAEVATSKNGLPLECFLVDPPIRVNAEDLGLSAVGVKLVTRADGTTDVWDIVGAEHYPNVADVLEEGRRFGFSRRLPSTLDFARLTSGSRLVLLHARGLIANYHDLDAARMTPCPRIAARHSLILRGASGEAADRYAPIPPTHELDFAEHTTCCCGIPYDDVTGGERMLVGSETDVRREMPSFAYSARYVAPESKRDYRLAIVAGLPISRLAVVRADDGRHEAVADRARRSTLDVSIEDA